VRISFDLDGVLADMDASLARIAEQEFGVTAKTTPVQPPTDMPGVVPSPGSAGVEAGSAGGSGVNAEDKDAPPPYDTVLLNALTARQQSRLWQRVRDTRNFWETLDECEPGTVRRIQKLAYALRWDVLFVTQRPGTAGRTQQLQTQHWLRRRGFEYPAVYTTIGSRGAIAAALNLDAHIDDRLQNCMDVAAESKAWPILVWREADSFDRVRIGATHLGIAVVRTVAEALDRIERADRASSQPEQPGLLDRLRRAFKA
jgi:hypothetical protein